MKYAVIASNPHPWYAFFLPLVCVAWRRVGYSPLLLLLDSPGWGHRPFTLARERADAGGLLSVQSVSGFRDSTVMQTSRLFAAATEMLRPDDYLLTTDADMIPLSGQLFAHASPAFAFHLFGADAYRELSTGLPPKFPMCYMGASVAAWREVMGIDHVDGRQKSLEKSLEGRVDEWQNDEAYFATRMFNSDMFKGELEQHDSMSFKKGRVQLIRRTGWTLPGAIAHKRLDRVSWNWNGDMGLLDCHAPRPGHGDKLLLKVLKAYFPDDARFIDDYVKDYRRLS